MEWIVTRCRAKLSTVNFLVINRNYVPFNKRNSTVSLVRVFLAATTIVAAERLLGRSSSHSCSKMWQKKAVMLQMVPTPAHHPNKDLCGLNYQVCLI